jgi:hypothetical protein
MAYLSGGAEFKCFPAVLDASEIRENVTASRVEHEPERQTLRRNLETAASRF